LPRRNRTIRIRPRPAKETREAIAKLIRRTPRYQLDAHLVASRAGIPESEADRLLRSYKGRGR
jgi:hypothetical protein